jgi:hypothetical protein
VQRAWQAQTANPALAVLPWTSLLQDDEQWHSWVDFSRVMYNQCLNRCRNQPSILNSKLSERETLIDDTHDTRKLSRKHHRLLIGLNRFSALLNETTADNENGIASMDIRAA